MNPDYDPYKYDKYDMREKYKDAYAGPLEEDLFTHNDYGRHAICRGQVGRVITQPGLVGALVLSYSQNKFTVRLSDGSTVVAKWDQWAGGSDPEGVSSDGWTIGDIKPTWTTIDDEPF